MHLLPNETILLTVRPSSRLPLIWFFSKALLSSVFIAGLSWVPWTIYNSPPERGAPPPHGTDTTLLVLLAAFIVTLLAVHAYNTFLARTYEYTITSTRFIFSGGILRRVRHAVEHRRVTDIQLSQNLVEQMISLHSISLFTPGTASVRPNSKTQPMPELRLEGLVEGEEVFLLVSQCVQKAKGDAA